MSPVYRHLRNGLCAALAFGLIASGRVRRARARALSEGLVTAIYFHRPRRSLFVRCIQWLRKYGYTFISANDLVQWLYHATPVPKGAIWVSFDDGYIEVLTDVLPLAQELGIPITLFVPSGIVAGDGLLPWLHKDGDRQGKRRGRDTLTVDELWRAAKRAEVTVGSHTVNHTVTASLSSDVLGFELGQSKRSLETWIEKPVECFAYPVGHFDGNERQLLARLGYVLAATTENAFVTRATDPYLVPRFSIGDEIGFAEAVCNLVGVWRPTIDPIIRNVQYARRIGFRFFRVFRRQATPAAPERAAASTSATAVRERL
jgi:peptidoglycan/xylan/chitin deacetylase (PgdA/CDA1 family)